MTARAATYGYILCFASLVCVAGCNRSERAVPIRVVDLIDDFDRAERRPTPGVRVPGHTIDGVTYGAIVMPVPSRVTWRHLLPRGGLLRTFVARADSAMASGSSGLPVRFRIGIADDRIYEGLTEIMVPPDQRGWIELRADLSAYAGWKWSVFYRPDRIIWNVVLAADALGAGETQVVWGAPEIVADTAAAREYVDRIAETATGGLVP